MAAILKGGKQVFFSKDSWIWVCLCEYRIKPHNACCYLSLLCAFCWFVIIKMWAESNPSPCCSAYHPASVLDCSETYWLWLFLNLAARTDKIISVTWTGSWDSAVCHVVVPIQLCIIQGKKQALIRLFLQFVSLPICCGENYISAIQTTTVDIRGRKSSTSQVSRSSAERHQTFRSIVSVTESP